MLNTLTELQFFIRSKGLGKLKLRKGLPNIPPPSENEREYYRLLLSQVFPETSDRELYESVLDIGCRNWSYVTALAEFFPKSELIGIEVDAGRRYWNLHRRGDVARAFAQELTQQGRSARFWEGDFREFEHLNSANRPLFCFFFPFVSENPCLKWGLPTRFVSFVELLNHARNLAGSIPTSDKNPFILSSHQGEWEAEEARRCYLAAGFDFREVVVNRELTAPYWPAQFDTHVFVAK